jgi:hypothetical protein
MASRDSAIPQANEEIETMGTRADFYIGKGKEAEWLGSIAFDGYPEKNAPPMESGAIIAITEGAFRAAVANLSKQDDFTDPKLGWPWPWEDSTTTDFAYCFVGDHVEVFCFGRPYDLAHPDDEIEGPEAEFPDMTRRQNVTYGRRSGALFLGRKS